MKHEALYLSRADVRAVGVDIARVSNLVELAFVEKAAGRTTMPPKLGVHLDGDSFLHAMPGHVPASCSLGIKWVSAYPSNAKRGLPQVAGLILLNDEDTGLPRAIMDCTWITAQRTAAASALAARHWALPESRALGIIGCGVQARTHLMALASAFPIERVYAFDISSAAAERFAEEARALSQLEVTCVNEAKRALVDSDIVVTCGPIQANREPSIAAGWLRPGAFASAVDFDSAWQPEALRELDRIVTDDVEQFEYYRAAGVLPKAPRAQTDLGRMVAGLEPGRTDRTERAMAMNLGVALADVVVANEIFQLALRKGIGVRLPL